MVTLEALPPPPPPLGPPARAASVSGGGRRKLGRGFWRLPHPTPLPRPPAAWRRPEPRTRRESVSPARLLRLRPRDPASQRAGLFSRGRRGFRFVLFPPSRARPPGDSSSGGFPVPRSSVLSPSLAPPRRPIPSVFRGGGPWARGAGEERPSPQPRGPLAGGGERKPRVARARVRGRRTSQDAMETQAGQDRGRRACRRAAARAAAISGGGGDRRSGSAARDGGAGGWAPGRARGRPGRRARTPRSPARPCPPAAASRPAAARKGRDAPPRVTEPHRPATAKGASPRRKGAIGSERHERSRQGRELTQRRRR